MFPLTKAGPGTGVQKRMYGKTPYTLDGRNATIATEYDEPVDIKLCKTPSTFFSNSDMLATANMIRHTKVKYFIDGMLLAVEDAMEKGIHMQMSKDNFLVNLCNGLLAKREKGNTAYDNAIVYIAAGLKLKNKPQSLPGGIENKVDSAIAEFNNAKTRSTPLAFYNWIPLGTQIWKSDRFLQSPQSRQSYKVAGTPESTQSDNDAMGLIKSIIKSDPDLQSTYDTILNTYSKISNKLEQKPCLFPGVVLPDQSLFESLVTLGVGGNLGKRLVGALKSGELSFKPKIDDGLYNRQMWEIEPWVALDTPEFTKLILDEKYKKALEIDFISAWAGTRESHVKFNDIMIGACNEDIPSNIQIYIHPELHVEPLFTTYKRIAESLTFVRDALESIFGQGFLDNISRYREDGSKLDIPLSEDFENIISIIKGCEQISINDLHIPFTPDMPAIEAAKSWLKNDAANDPDMNHDIRLIVPIIGTPDGSAITNYVVTGFSFDQYDFWYNNLPIVNTGRQVDVNFRSCNHIRPTLEHIEIDAPLGSGQFTNPEIRNLLDKMHPEELKESIESGKILSDSVK